MRLVLTLILAVGTLMVGCLDNISAVENGIPSSISKTAISNLVSSVKTPENDKLVARTLRTGEETDERTNPKLHRMFSDLSDDFITAAKKLARSKSMPGFTPKERLDQYYALKDKNKPYFEHMMTTLKMNPEQAKDHLGLTEKMKTAIKAELDTDEVYLFWKSYEKYWMKHSPFEPI
ncbi:RxLR effector protein [Phytophthora megakarya]|uniref:RxLR effector protein n=1 Tax=Phytophthora megakarya TaxID=4795 RepID=A0A225W3M2_9STRA|nr:RxLR effector protein [Phytophthora megakarya]